MLRFIVFILGAVSLVTAVSNKIILSTHHPICTDYYIIPTSQDTTESFVTPQDFTHRCDEKTSHFYQGAHSFWFRLEGLGGTGIINHKPERTGICGAKYPGWIQAELPRPFGMTPGAKLCYNKPPNGYTCPEQLTCTDYRRIDIFNCNGEFFLYKMYPKSAPPSTNCAEAFCTGDVGLCELQTYENVPTLPEMTLNYRTTPASGQNPRCDHEADYADGKTWIRLQGSGGTEIIHDQPSRKTGVCGTQIPGWITGSRPGQLGTAVQSELCYSIGSNGKCTDGRRIDLMNCWSFILYRLHPSSSNCAKAFCTHKPIYDVCNPNGYQNTTAYGLRWSTQAYNPQYTERKNDDQYADGLTWIKFYAEDGPKVISTTKQSQNNRCNIDNLGWMEGQIPRTAEGVVQRKLCYYDGSATPCPQERDIDVANCGSFLLYRFHKVSSPTKSAFCIDPDTHGPCYYRPCLHGSECVGKGHCYKCNCPTGVSGRNCEVGDTNECNSQPCKNGGTCYDDFGKYSCVCKPGFTGVNCDTEIDKCKSNPCQNRGTCVKRGDGYECQCPTGYIGNNCETEVTDGDECSPNPCKNGGNCIDGVETFTCQCAFRWKGKTCEDDTDIRCIIHGITKNYDTDEGDGGGGGFFSWLGNLFNGVFTGLLGLLGGIGSIFNLANIGNLLNSLDNLNNPDNPNNPQNPNDQCSTANVGSALEGLRSGIDKCKRKYDNKKCTIREKAKPKEEKPEPPPTQPTEAPTEAPKETTTTEKPSSCTATCSAVQNPGHGARMGDKTSCGDSVSFSCEKGYKLQGCAEPQCKITCQEDGQWSNQPPKCVKTTCGGLVTLSAKNPQQNVEKTESSDHSDCNWAITSEKPSDILLRFSAFNLPNSVSGKRTCQDYVEIIAGTRRDRFCGARSDDEVTITNAGMIRFHSSSSQAHFKVELTLQTGCGSSLGLFRRSSHACMPCKASADTRKEWPRHVSVITSEDSLNVKLPNNIGVLKFIHGEKAIAWCTGSEFMNFAKIDKVTLECTNGRFDVTYTDTDGNKKSENSKQFHELGCKALPEPKLWEDTISKKIHIGWVADKLTQITINYDKERKVPKYAEHTVHGLSVLWSEKHQRPEFKNSRNLKIIGINEVRPDAYKKVLQYQRLGNKYIDCCDAHYLVRGHLAPNADFSLRSWRDATFYMVNVAPQWQVINAGNWKILEDEIRNYAYERKADIKVISGTYGQLELDGKQINFPEPNPSTPVPSHFWKVVHDENLNAAVAFVILNNPYATADTNGLPEDKLALCTSQCDFLRTATKQTASKGLLMCCSLDDLRNTVKFIPVLTVTELWKSGNVQALDFGERLAKRLT